MSVLRNTTNENSSVRKTKQNKLIHLSKFIKVFCLWSEKNQGTLLTPFRMGLFESAHKWAKRPPSPKFVTHIIQG